jgi:hypothetical protein
MYPDDTLHNGTLQNSMLSNDTLQNGTVTNGTQTLCMTVLSHLLFCNCTV